MSIYKLSVLSHWSASSFYGFTSLFVDLAARAEPGDHPPATLSMQTLLTAGLLPTPPPSVPQLTPRVASFDSVNTTALPPWTLYSMPQAHTSTSIPSQAPSPYLQLTCILEGSLLLDQWLWTSSASTMTKNLQTCLPSTFCNYTFFNEILTPISEKKGSSSKLVFTPKLVLFQP